MFSKRLCKYVKCNQPAGKHTHQTSDVFTESFRALKVPQKPPILCSGKVKIRDSCHITVTHSTASESFQDENMKEKNSWSTKRLNRINMKRPVPQFYKKNRSSLRCFLIFPFSSASGLHVLEEVRGWGLRQGEDGVVG